MNKIMLFQIIWTSYS